MERKKSIKPVKSLSEILLPFEISFPITIELGVNDKRWTYPAREKVYLHSYAEYEALSHSSYAKYLGH